MTDPFVSGILVGVGAASCLALFLFVIFWSKSQKVKTALEKSLFETELSAKSAEERLQASKAEEERLSHLFKSIAASTLSDNQQSFMGLATEVLSKVEQNTLHKLESKEQAMDRLVAPIAKALDAVQSQVKEIEKDRAASFRTLQDQMINLQTTNVNLAGETAKLASALKSSSAVRGTWGELQLKRVAEMSGMLEYCDFFTQSATTDQEGKIIRPDMVIRLPGDKIVAVDAKAPIKSYLLAAETEDPDEQKRHMEKHCELIRKQMQQLARKAYWKSFEKTPEFVLMFLPGESFFSSALAVDPALIEDGIKQNVIITTPTTLLALLKTVAFSWRHENLAENTELIAKLGSELFQRIADFSCHMEELGKGLNQSVQSYNSAVGSLERRVLVTSRKFKKLGINTAKKSIAQLDGIDEVPRSLNH